MQQITKILFFLLCVGGGGGIASKLSLTESNVVVSSSLALITHILFFYNQYQRWLNKLITC